MSAVPAMLTVLGEGGAFEAIDLQLADVMVRRSGLAESAGPPVALLTALLSRARREGHSGLTLTQLAEQALSLRDEAKDVLSGAVDDPKWWERTLASIPIIGTGSGFAPIVLRSPLLQFWRYYEAESRIADRVVRALRLPADNVLAPFGIITGGPGTGKTTLVARMLTDLEKKAPALTVALAAPTGKAAARLSESIRARTAEAGDGRAMLTTVSEARTLHRLLRYSPNTDTYRANESDPLDEDLVIADEASMVDILMLDALLRAIRPSGKVLLVGDHHQLASVDTGDVLGTLCRTADSGTLPALKDRVTTLTRSWRFEKQPAIGQLANAVLAGDAALAEQVCSGGGEVSSVRLMPLPPAASQLLEPVVPQLRRCLQAKSPEESLAALDAFRILAPEREGRLGVQGINDAVERWLAQHGRAVHEPWYHGRPVLVTANDYATGVFNGDLGVVWRDGANVSVHFPGNDRTIRAIAPIRLPAVETAWAMTVHKAQGSEFDRVLVVIPDHDSRVMSRELLYTAITRARENVTLMANPASLERAIARRTGRTSGLEARLAEAWRKE